MSYYGRRARIAIKPMTAEQIEAGKREAERITEALAVAVRKPGQLASFDAVVAKIKEQQQ